LATAFLSFLDIKDVVLNDKAVKWSVAERSEPYGSPLSIKLDKGIEKGKQFSINVCLILHMDTESRERQSNPESQGQIEYNRQMHGVAMAHASPNFQQEASLYV
jgi:hypothetical protein